MLEQIMVLAKKDYSHKVHQLLSMSEDNCKSIVELL